MNPARRESRPPRTGCSRSWPIDCARRRPGPSHSQETEQPEASQRPSPSPLSLRQMAALLDVAEDAIVIADDRHQITYWNGGAEKTYGWQAKDALGQVFEDLIPTEFPIARTEVEVAIRDLGVWEGELTHVRKDGRRIVVSNRTTRAQGRADLLSVSRDITPVKEAREAMASAKEHLAREVDERTRDLQRTAVALQAEVVGRTEAERTMRANRDTVRAILEAAAQGILVADRQGTIHLVNPAMAAIFGYDRAELIGRPIDVLLPERVRERHAGHWEAWWTAPTTGRMGAGLALTGCRRDGSEVPLEVSLSYVDGPEGRLAVGFFSDITDRLRADAALRTSEQELRDLSGRLLTVVEDERRRIARELHDDVVQQLGLCAWEVDRLTVRVRPSTPDTTDGLRALKDRVSRVLVDVRRLARGLHPATLQLLGLEEALWAFCESVTQAHGPSIVFSGSLQSDALDEPTKIGLYHIAQEAIANAVAHADASEIRVDLRSVQDGVRLTIQDNGRGFTPDPSRPRGLGLVSMAERARLARGSMTIEGRPGGGTTVDGRGAWPGPGLARASSRPRHGRKGGDHHAAHSRWSWTAGRALQPADQQFALVDHLRRQVIVQVDEQFLVTDHFLRHAAAIEMPAAASNFSLRKIAGRSSRCPRSAASSRSAFRGPARGRARDPRSTSARACSR